MPKLKQTSVEKALCIAKCEVGRAMIQKGWNREHTAKLVPWNIKSKYEKLCKFFQNPGTINLYDFALLLDKLGLKIEIKEKGVNNDV